MKTLTYQEEAIHFYKENEKHFKAVCKFLEATLIEHCFVYAQEENLPSEAFRVNVRLKTLSSFLKKIEGERKEQLASNQQNEFKFSKDLINDLIGGRITCWFLEDCEKLAFFFRTEKCKILKMKDENVKKNFIINPKPSGYRGLHLFAEVPHLKGSVVVEMQIRTKLQDAWGDITHEFHYKAKSFGIENKKYESILANAAKRLSAEDEELGSFRRLYEEMANINEVSIKDLLQRFKYNDDTDTPRIVEERTGQFNEICDWIIGDNYKNIYEIHEIVERYRNQIEALEIQIERINPQVTLSCKGWPSSLLLIYILSIENDDIRNKYIKNDKEREIIVKFKK